MTLNYTRRTTILKIWIVSIIFQNKYAFAASVVNSSYLSFISLRWYNTKNMKRKIISLCFFGLISVCIVHASARNEIKDLTIYAIKGPTGVGMIRLFEEPPEIQGFNVKLEAFPSPDLIAARFISGEAMAGILPVNMAAKIASSGRDIRAAAVTGTGMLNLLSSDPNVKSIEDLKGKTVEVSSGQGATPDFVFRRILNFHGLNPDRDLVLGYSLSYPELAQSLISGRSSIALLPEPFATMALKGRPDLKQVVDIQEEWVKTGGAGGSAASRNYPMTVLVFDGAFASANPAVAGEILDAVKKSIEWVTAHPEEAGVLVEKHGFGLKAPVVAASVPRSNFVFIPAVDARSSIEALLTLFLEYSPVSIGNALPQDKFYYR